MSYVRGPKKSFIISNEIIEKNPKLRVEQNIIKYLNQANEKGKLKKISTINEAKIEWVLQNKNNYNCLNENVHIDFERKNKAGRSLLYLLNKMSGGTFCPQIVNYFNEIRELNKQEEQLKEVKEEIPENSEEPIIKQEKTLIPKNCKNLLTNFKKPILSGQNKSNYINYKFQRRSGKNNIPLNEKNEINIISKNYSKDIGLKDMEEFIDSEEIDKAKVNRFNFNREAQAKKNILEEYTYDRTFPKKKKKTLKYQDKIIYDEEQENRMEIIPNFKKNAFPNIKKLQLNRMNTISGGGFFKKNNFLNKEKYNYNN